MTTATSRGTTEGMTVGRTGPRRVLVAIDGSPSSDVAVGLVARLAWPAGTAIRLVEAIDVGPGLFGGPWPALGVPSSGDLEVALRTEAQREVEDARSRLDAPGRTVTTAVESGRAASVILDEARAMPADLIVIGSRGHGTITSMLLGSVSSEVIDHAPAPVLVARDHPMDRVIVAWDGSPTAALGAEVVRTWPILAGAEVRVVTVADIGMPWWTGFSEVGANVGAQQPDVMLETTDVARRAAASLAGDLAAELTAAGRHAVADVRDGDAATEIIASARDWAADLVVIGTHGRTGLARLTLGSVASNVTRHAPCSVLVVRHGGPAEGVPRT